MAGGWDGGENTRCSKGKLLFPLQRQRQTADVTVLQERYAASTPRYPLVNLQLIQ